MVVLRALVAEARGDYARADQLLQPIASQNPTSDAALERGLLQLYLGQRTDARRTLQLILLSDSPNARARDYLRAARCRPAHWAAIKMPTICFAKPIAMAANDPTINTGVGRSVPGKIRSAERRQVVPDRAEDRPDIWSRAPGHGPGVGRRESAAVGALGRTGAQGQPARDRRPSSDGADGRRSGQEEGSARGNAEGAGDQSEESRSTGRCRPGSITSRVAIRSIRRASPRRSRSIQPTVRSTASSDR